MYLSYSINVGSAAPTWMGSGFQFLTLGSTGHRGGAHRLPERSFCLTFRLLPEGSAIAAQSESSPAGPSLQLFGKASGKSDPSFLVPELPGGISGTYWLYLVLASPGLALPGNNPFSFCSAHGPPTTQHSARWAERGYWIVDLSQRASNATGPSQSTWARICELWTCHDIWIGFFL